jgi:hypothetical protein
MFNLVYVFFTVGLQSHVDQIVLMRQSMRTLLQTVSTYRVEYISNTYTCYHRSFLFEQRLSRLLSLICTWFFLAAENDVI